MHGAAEVPTPQVLPPFGEKVASVPYVGAWTLACTPHCMVLSSYAHLCSLQGVKAWGANRMRNPGSLVYLSAFVKMLECAVAFSV